MLRTMSGGRIFDRPGYPPVDRPPPPGAVLRPVMATRAVQAFTTMFLVLSSLAVLPEIAALVVIPVALVLAARAYNAGRIVVEVDGLRLAGLLRTRTLRREQVDSVNNWLIRWRRTPQSRLRRWQLWPYLQAGVMLPGVRRRSDEVMECLVSLVASWKAPGTPAHPVHSREFPHD